MNTRHIASIYFYAISAAALALIVVGIFATVNFVINTTQYDTYPLRFRGKDCETYPYAYSKPVPAANGLPISTPTQKELDGQKKKCQIQLEKERKQQKLDDLKSSLTFSIVGLVLFLIHFPKALKHTKEAK
ncbi:MAG: hypothetical protein A3F31_01035 [Candidatus Levybacteria bacterium RIFCSPHIGHO2_12_FULL_38_12]|nr:MAG: hypothetical protein A2770_01665 [Candidatus Levybacteria bacterium RIFCSPHIGHO2_01_FULL_38_12]OGH22004.1 MAG: hypothetical protein A3D75_03195 [Candidatus Levybacteria bacterium RIFCSPHIGHO2_02_FULL_37_18]OGH23075.1 MAG: hypothetical protein A3F31_01035 [Candidatus Levybacteria bacterium RIFCSPHIGHO2_12_FULL_38_12]OGH33697.1 MAG: hypothetical protein A3A47_02630 [Candidatus Levybacteria bacterium RIFCSPLOWO2_01_FULL_37_20]OGH44603.1 MAG: hypothetical protein A3J14_00715 [Candidatus Lev